MDGIGMMLKAFGLNPDDLKATAAEWMKTAQTTVNYFVARHDRTDAALARMEATLADMQATLATLRHDKVDTVTADHYWMSEDARGKPN